MKFFVPAADDADQAERVVEAVRLHIQAPLQSRRIASLSWQHAGLAMFCSVGSKAPAYYQTGNESVVAIFDCGAIYKVCTESRGVARGDGIFVGKSEKPVLTFFDE